jgi:hypothetical protein
MVLANRWSCHALSNQHEVLYFPTHTNVFLMMFNILIFVATFFEIKDHYFFIISTQQRQNSLTFTVYNEFFGLDGIVVDAVVLRRKRIKKYNKHNRMHSLKIKGHCRATIHVLYCIPVASIFVAA